ncbi:MAG TPA: LCP family protein [Pseudonocardiaceae bacterium]|nr:LCP family protein [Pseudonocardiaceae bacterium]
MIPKSPDPRSTWARLAGRIAVAVVSGLVLSITGYAWAQYHILDSGIDKSDALAGEATSLNGDANILIMGLDSRLDENGNALPADIYNALHAGDSSDGGYNSNVLMLLHVPANGGKATAISIPRDDYVQFPGSPDGVSAGKIKQAYGFAKDQKEKELASQGVTDRTQLEQQSRDAGRKEEVDTVRQFLGGATIDHFVEVTLVSFFQIAQVVQPITVCVNEDTQDSYSGANFHQGQQQINASQAVAFVRQRRDYVHPALNFTDLDRERRQQAFIASLAYQLKQGGVFTDPGKLSQLLSVAKANIAVDQNLDLLTFAQQASNLTGGNITFYTMPIKTFGKVDGQDVNIVDTGQVQAIASQLLSGSSNSSGSAGSSSPAAPAPTGSSLPVPSGTVDVVNDSGATGLAAKLEKALTAKGYTQGSASTGSRIRSSSTVYYGSGASSAASTVAGMLGISNTQPNSSLSSGHVQVTVGTDFSMPASLGDGSSSSGTSSSSSSGSAASSAAPPPGSAAPANSSSLSAVSGGGIPCVK